MTPVLKSRNNGSRAGKKVLFPLTVSLAVNAVLLFVFLHQRAGLRAPVIPLQRAAPAPELIVREAPNVPLDAHTWTALTTGSDEDMVARLKQEGFPPNLIWRVASARISDKYRSRRQALLKDRSVRYWRESFSGAMSQPTMDKETRAKMREIEKEQAAELDKLVGSERPTDTGMALRWEKELYGDLPPNAARTIQAIDKDYRELQLQVQAETGGISFPEDQQKFDYLEKERLADLAKNLTPEEFRAYELRASETALGLKSQLEIFDPTEAEYQAIFQAQRAFESKYDLNALSGDEARELREAEMRKVLSPERFEDYKVKTSGSYRPVRDLVNQLRLPEETISKVIHLQQETILQANQLRADPSLTTQQRNERLNVLSQNASATLKTTFGEDGFLTYKMTAGRWIKNVQPQGP